MFCSNCGTEYNVESTNFCPKCGTSVHKTLPPEETKNSQIAFYKIGTTKLIILSVTTLWLFEFYWFYKNWSAMRKVDGKSLNPFIATLFFPISSFGLFKKVLIQAKESGYPKSYSAGWLAFIFFVLTYIGSTLINDDAIFYQHSDEAGLWLFLVGVYIAQAFILGIVQKAVNHGK